MNLPASQLLLDLREGKCQREDKGSEKESKIVREQLPGTLTT